MQITNLKLINFKNCESEVFVFDDGINLLYGDNGVGKTNLLDALYLLSIGKSYFSLADRSLVKDGEEFYRLEAKYLSQQEKKSSVVFKYKKDQRRSIEIDGQKIKHVREVIGRHPIVMVAPDDISIVYGGSKERRDFYNRILCQSDLGYLNALMKYNKLLRQKDALLKSTRRPDELSIAALNHQMIPLAQSIFEIRKSSSELLSSLILSHYSTIAVQEEEILITYNSIFHERDVASEFERVIDHELMAKRPLVGIQRDDYLFEIGGKPLKKFGSQGQIKSFLYSIRMAEYYYLAKALDKKPILILDDYFEKLDRSRLSHLLQLINTPAFGQIFLTDTELERSKTILEKHDISFASYQVSDKQ